MTGRKFETIATPNQTRDLPLLEVVRVTRLANEADQLCTFLSLCAAQGIDVFCQRIDHASHSMIVNQ